MGRGQRVLVGLEYATAVAFAAFAIFLGYKAWQFTDGVGDLFGIGALIVMLPLWLGVVFFGSVGLLAALDATCRILFGRGLRRPPRPW